MSKADANRADASTKLNLDCCNIRYAARWCIELVSELTFRNFQAVVDILAKFLSNTNVFLGIYCTAVAMLGSVLPGRGDSVV